MSWVKQVLNAAGDIGSDGVRRVGSKLVSAIDESTLPGGYKRLAEFVESPKYAPELATGKSRWKMTKNDLSSFLNDAGYDTVGTKDELWKSAAQAYYDDMIDDLFMNDGAWAANFLQYR